MGCMLRAIGERFDPIVYLEASPFETAAVFRKGDPSPAGARQPWPASGFHLTVSEAAEDDLDGQIDEAIEFLDRHEEELRRLAQFPGVQQVEIDFTLQWRDHVSQADTFPPELLWRAGALDIALVVTHHFLAHGES